MSMIRIKLWQVTLNLIKICLENRRLVEVLFCTRIEYLICIFLEISNGIESSSLLGSYNCKLKVKLFGIILQTFKKFLLLTSVCNAPWFFIFIKIHYILKVYASHFNELIKMYGSKLFTNVLC